MFIHVRIVRQLLVVDFILMSIICVKYIFCYCVLYNINGLHFIYHNKCTLSKENALGKKYVSHGKVNFKNSL
jgi:hypothetical protein